MVFEEARMAFEKVMELQRLQMEYEVAFEK